MTRLWRPSPEHQRATQLARFMERVDVGVTGDGYDYDALWLYSVTESEAFWSQAWDALGIIGEKGDRVLECGDGLESSRFFPDARLNFAANLLKRRDDACAIDFYGEDGTRRSLTFRELRQDVARLQSALAADGVGVGDRVAAVVANVPEAVVAMLAVTSLGAVWSSCSPDFGVNGILDRFSQIAPSVLFTMDGYRYGGRWFDTGSTGSDVAAALPALRRHVRISYQGADGPHDDSALSYNAYLDPHEQAEPKVSPIGFNEPLVILFSSGTTGPPKCIVHSAGGVLLQHAKEHRLHGDIRSNDRMCYFTTAGWMMWNWMVSALQADASLILFDGMPMTPSADRLPTLIADTDVTHFGASARYFSAAYKAGVAPAESRPLAHLRTVYSTGSPLAPDTFDYLYKSWKSDLCVASIAGGTDILGCFVGPSPISPVYRGQCQKRLLGMDVQVYDTTGKPLSGAAGELVCTNPHPSIPIGFLNDSGGQRFHAAYFERYPGVWHHGDWVELTPEGGMIFHGRSDATLNPSGVRIGTAEIYRPVEAMTEILEALVIDHVDGDRMDIVLFVTLAAGIRLDAALEQTIREQIRNHASPRHVPRHIIAVPEIPRTRSGKIVELAVRDVIHGRPVRNRDALANPEALSHFRNLPDLTPPATDFRL